MATQQKEGGVPFSMAHEMQQFRLFELPPEIVDMLEAPNPPHSLSIKSQATSNGPNAKPAYAVLCTPTKSYQLRQVQTSNTLFVTAPALEAHGNDFPVPVTRAIASCTATLELLSSHASAATLLREALPVYDIVAGDADATGTNKSKPSIFEHLPLSNGECQAGWKEVVAFEHEGSSFLPSTNALAHIWKSINAVGLAEGIKLNSQFLTDDITRPVADEGHPPSFVTAVLEHLSTHDQDTNGPWSCLDREKTVAFTGKLLLQTKQGNDYLIAEFTDAWQDQLPEAWRQDAKLEAIEGAYLFPTDTTIQGVGEMETAGAKNASTTAAMKPSARKWHEKFGKTRKK